MDIVSTVATFTASRTLVKLWDGDNLPKIELPDVSVNVVSGATWLEDEKTWQLEYNGIIKSGIKNKVNGIFHDKRLLNIKAYLKSEDNVELFLDNDLNDKLITIEYVFCQKIELNIRSLVKTEILVKSLRKPRFDIKGNGGFVESKRMMQGYFLSKIQIKKGEAKVKAANFES